MDRPKRILILSGSPKKKGNTSLLIEWFKEGAKNRDAVVEWVDLAYLEHNAGGCTACLGCQKLFKYECVIEDDISKTLKRIPDFDMIVMATPLYFFGPSAQLKAFIDRMYSLFKFSATDGSYSTILNNKELCLIASAADCMEPGLRILEKMFHEIAAYSKMGFISHLVPNAGISGNLKENSSVRVKTIAFGEKVS